MRSSGRDFMIWRPIFAVSTTIGYVLASAGCATLRPNGGFEQIAGVPVAPAGAQLAGKSVAQWSEMWWQWLLAVPNIHDPGLDQTGEKCQYGQSGPVWFLAGSYGGGKVVRRCTIQEGKYVLFPV